MSEKTIEHCLAKDACRRCGSETKAECKETSIAPEESREFQCLEGALECARDGHEAYVGTTRYVGIPMFIGSLTYIAIKLALGHEFTEDDRIGLPLLACYHPSILYVCRFITWLDRRSAEKDLERYFAK